MVNFLSEWIKNKVRGKAWQLDQVDLITRSLASTAKSSDMSDKTEILTAVTDELSKIYKCDGVWLLRLPLEDGYVPIVHWRSSKYKDFEKYVPPILDRSRPFFDAIEASTEPVIFDNCEQYSTGRAVSSALACAIRTSMGQNYILGIHQSKFRKWTICEIRLFADICARLQYVLTMFLLTQRMNKIAHYDELTKLPNRLMFTEKSKQIGENAITRNQPAAAFLIDLDNFKFINDTHGHHSGDIVLQAISRRLETIAKSRCEFRKNMGDHNTQPNPCSCVVARLGGDEFVMVFENMGSHEADLLGQHLVQEMKESIKINGIEVTVSSSVGIAVYPVDGVDIHQLMKSADLAMYAAKDRGKNQFCFHESSMNTKIQRRVEAELAVREMIYGKNLTVYYQPIINTETGNIIGAEALLRGKKATDKFFNPVELITAAEDTNLIIPLGTLILQNACTFARQCIDVIGGDCAGFVSVNVSAFQLAHYDFASIVEKTLHDCDLTPDYLVLEITETMLMQNFEDSARTLEKLRNIGVRISIDDFGKGYSSFNYLQTLPIDKIKIDMSFIQNLGIDKKANEIVKGIILMADALGMHTCAEGVETKLQYDKLLEYGCEQVQGHYKYSAMDTRGFLDMLNRMIVKQSG